MIMYCSVAQKTIILADGIFPEHETPFEILTGADFIVCCDGAVEKLVAHGLEPSMIVGDLDSLSPEMKNRYESILFFDPDQETNDLTKAVNWCISHERKDIIILGATGLREDHTLGNISLLAEYSKIAAVKMVTDYGIFEVHREKATIESWPGQQISIFSMNSSTVVTSYGLEYPLNGLLLDNWWKGSLNQAMGENFTLEFTGGPLIVFRKF
jgi:thiamine pyrophosphokinase